MELIFATLLELIASIVDAFIGLLTFTGGCIGGGLGAAVGIIGMWLAHKTNERMIKERRLEFKKREINDQLNKFYGPYQQRLKTSRNLSEKLRRNKPADWRALTALIVGEKLSHNDLFIIDQINEITSELDNLRLQNCGLIDDYELQELLAKASINFRLLRCAREGKFSGEVDRFSEFVYPRELNDKIDEKINELKRELSELM